MQKSIHTSAYRQLVKLLREAREARGVTQTAMAERLGITASQLSKWERRERRVDVREVALYCSCLGIDVGDFVRDWWREASGT